MKKYLTILTAGIIVFSAVALQAQNRSQPAGAKKLVHKGKAYLLDGTGSGKISKRKFDSLVAFTLIARDTLNKEYPVSQFTFTYAERAVYEDSTGREQIMTDYNSVESDKGKLPDFWIRNLKKRTKEGDTVTFSEIKSHYADSQRTSFYVQPLKLVITE